VVAVGDSAEIELVFRAGAATGRPVNKKATVTTNDNSQGSFRIGFVGNVYLEANSTHMIAIEPKAISFNEENQDDEIEIKVVNQTDEKLKMELISYPRGVLKVDVDDDDIKPGKDREIEVEIDDDFEGSSFDKSFTIELNDPMRTRYTIPVRFALPLAAPQPGAHGGKVGGSPSGGERRGK
jgi:hypothetical protein